MKRSVVAGFLLLIALAMLMAQAPKPAANDPRLGTNAQSKQAALGESFRCPVTVPNEKTYTGEPGVGGNYWNEALSTGLWPEGKVVFKPGGPGSAVPEDGALAMKFWWWRLVRGRLTIEGRRLDNPAPPLRSIIPDGYGEIGFQATGLVFPTPGCWEVTGRIGDKSLTFVTLVVKIGEGPGR
jgi:hypothetical protein